MCPQQTKRWSSQIFLSNFLRIYRKFSLLFAGKRSMVDALHFGHPGSTNLLGESSVFWWSGMKKNIENKCSTCTSCKSSGKNLKYQLPYTETIKLPALTKPGQKIQIHFFGNSYIKHEPREPYIFIGIDRYCKWPVVWICKSTGTKEVGKVLESFLNCYGVPDKIKSDRRSAFISRELKLFCKNLIIKIEYSTLRLNSGTGQVERAIQTLRKIQ